MKNKKGFYLIRVTEHKTTIYYMDLSLSDLLLDHLLLLGLL